MLYLLEESRFIQDRLVTRHDDLNSNVMVMTYSVKQYVLKTIELSCIWTIDLYDSLFFGSQWNVSFPLATGMKNAQLKALIAVI